PDLLVFDPTHSFGPNQFILCTPPTCFSTHFLSCPLIFNPTRLYLTPSTHFWPNLLFLDSTHLS
ncbi:hypothetical protein PAXRUDRAFT_777018, partial [Paxillus rubicundulus Ve08.2h10]